MFNDIFRYLDDIFTIDNPEFEYLSKGTLVEQSKTLQTKKPLLVVVFIPAFTTNAITSDFLSSISPGWVMTFLDSHRLLFTFLSWLDLLGVALAFRISILKIFKLLPDY